MAHARDDIIEKGIIAALDLAETRRWSELTLSDIATAAGLTLNDFHGVASVESLAEAVERHFDKAMSGEGIDPEETPRERLFDVIMLRFEAMEARRAGVLSLVHYREQSPIRLAKHLAARKASADWALVSAGLDGADQAVPRDIRSVAVAYAMAQAERAWRKETDPGFARTMSKLDEELRKLEDGAGRFANFRGGRRKDTTQPEGEAWDGDPPPSGEGPADAEPAPQN
ncbi:MAG: hypothetical protein AAFQ22_08740 [Pseudomonadota bacterium]